MVNLTWHFQNIITITWWMMAKMVIASHMMLGENFSMQICESSSLWGLYIKG